MSTSKPLLKKAKDALGNKDYKGAKEVCQMLLLFDGENYQGLVYMAVALYNLNLSEESETYYQRAIKLNPTQPLAFQGLLTLYEKTDQKDKLVDIYQQARNVYSLTENNDSKIIELTLKLANLYADSAAQVDLRIQTLKSLLPGGDYHPQFLRSKSDVTPLSLLQTIAPLEAQRDQARILKEIEARRRRLSNDSMEVIATKVRTEVYLQTEYMDTLEKIMTYKEELTTEDWILVNRQYLQFLLDMILQSYVKTKIKILEKLCSNARNLINEGYQLDLAYEILLNFEDVKHPDDYNPQLLNDYVKLFPEGSFYHHANLLLSKSQGDSDPSVVNFIPPKDVSLSSTGMLESHYCLWSKLDEKKPDEALKLAKSLETFLKQFSENGVSQFPNVVASVRLGVGFGYLLKGPKEYELSHKIFQDVLTKDPHHQLALKGLADYGVLTGNLEVSDQAFSTLISLNSRNDYALSGLGWVYILQGKPDAALSLIQDALSINPSSAMYNFRLGRAYWDMGGSSRTDTQFAYTHLVNAIQLDPELGPPFLYLGHYYSETKDLTRATQCYTKACQLSPTEQAYRCLYDLQITMDDTVGACNTVTAASLQLPKSSWAWGTLGNIQLTNQQFLDATTSFRTALKSDSCHVGYWEGLGEAYLEVGRFTAALKAFQRTSQLTTASIASQYYIALIEMKLGQFTEATQSLKSLLAVLAEDHEAQQVYHIPSLKLYGDIFYRQAQVAFRSGAYGLMAEYITNGLQILHELIRRDAKLGSVWELVGDLCLLFRLIPHQVTEHTLTFPQAILASLSEFIDEVDVPELTELVSELNRDTNNVSFLLRLASFSYQYALRISSDPECTGMFLYKSGLATYAIHHFLRYFTQDGTREPDYETAQQQLLLSLQIVKAAISRDPAHAAAWNLLGIITLTEAPNVSQHAFSQAIALEPKNPSPLTNYGFLCLIHQDYELAKQAFARAHTLQPEFAPAWAGQAILALVTQAPQAQEVVSHVVSLKETISIHIFMAYSSLLFQSHLREGKAMDRDSVASGLYALQKFTELNPRCASALNLLSVYYEQADCLSPASEALATAQGSLIAQHQAAESQLLPPDRLPKVFANFVSVQLRRGQLLAAQGQYHQAVDAYMAASGCVEHLGGKISSTGTVLLYLGLGTAHFHLGNYDASLKVFELALERTHQDPTTKLARRVALQLAQVLWALGTATHRDLAVQQLLNCVKNRNITVEVLSALAVMGLMKQDTVLLSAACQELQALPPHHEECGPTSTVPTTLAELHLHRGATPLTALTTLHRALHHHPTHYLPYLHLARYLLHLTPSSSPSSPSSPTHSQLLPLTQTGLTLAIAQAAPAHHVSELYTLQAQAISPSPPDQHCHHRATFYAPWIYLNTPTTP